MVLVMLCCVQQRREVTKKGVERRVRLVGWICRCGGFSCDAFWKTKDCNGGGSL